MDEITKERMEVWERRLEGGLDGGDVRDVLDEWEQDVERVMQDFLKAVDQNIGMLNLINEQNSALLAFGEKIDFMSKVIDKLSGLGGAEEYLKEVDYYNVTEGFVGKHKEEVDKLKDRDRFLGCLEAAGVDNWTGYSDAWELFDEEGN